MSGVDRGDRTVRMEHPRAGRGHKPVRLLLLCVLSCGCSTLTPDGARVSVYQAPLDALPPQHGMPTGCRLVQTKPAVSMTELDMEGQKDPFRLQRNEAATSGANVLLVLRRMILGRRDSECTAGLRITDCPPGFGAWFRVVVQSYACSPDALRTLSMLPPSPDQNIGRIDGPR
jgi:hypothetical protein